MNVSYHIALRYLFSKKSHSAINIVSLISVCGVAVGVMALVCVLSVYNGFQGVIDGLFGSFDPQIRICSSSSKSFYPDTVYKYLPEDKIDCYSSVIEDNALLEYNNKQLPVVVNGVDDNYGRLTDISSLMVDGEYPSSMSTYREAVLGVTLARSICSGVGTPVVLYAPKKKITTTKSFNREIIFTSGDFQVLQEKYDNAYVFIPIELADSLFEYNGRISFIDIKLKCGVDEEEFIDRLQDSLGVNYNVMDRYEQQWDFYRMMKIEKWITFLILGFILMIAVFNIVGSLSMLIIDKRDDIVVLSNLGMRMKSISNVFLIEGCLITFIGAIVGVILGVVLCYLQATYGFITMGAENSYIVNVYPVDVQVSDIVVIFFTVLILGFFSAIIPSRHIIKKA